MMHSAAADVDERIGPAYGKYARSAAEGLSGFAETLRGKQVDELIDDATAFVRRSPAIAIGTAAAVGFVLARLIKSGIDAAADLADRDDKPRPDGNRGGMTARSPRREHRRIVRPAGRGCARLRRGRGRILSALALEKLEEARASLWIGAAAAGLMIGAAVALVMGLVLTLSPLVGPALATLIVVAAAGGVAWVMGRIAWRHVKHLLGLPK
ncbi:MAG: phage holin family protein [Sphingomonas sp.]